MLTEQGRVRISASASSAAPATARKRWTAESERGRRVPRLDYRLVVLTNGRPCLRETLESFRQRFTPQPSELLIFDDGGTAKPFGGGSEWANVPLTTIASAKPLGFCGAVRECWRAASQPGVEYVFWLEDDFLFDRDVDVLPLAATLEANPRLAQMALMRQAVNSEEIAAGGCFNLRRELYTDMDGWLESRTNFSTTCSLIRRQFMLAEPWPDYLENCEGRYSIDLLAKGYTFGVWGDGSPQITHVGVRSGHGY